MPDEREREAMRAAAAQMLQGPDGPPIGGAERTLVKAGWLAAMEFSKSSREAAEAEVERLQRAALNDTYLDEGAELVLNDLRKTKAENVRLREALTAVAGYKHAPLIESLDDARRVAAAALSPKEDA